jgi:hypothetical protein
MDEKMILYQIFMLDTLLNIEAAYYEKSKKI